MANCDHNIKRLANMVFVLKLRMKSHVGIDLEKYMKPMDVKDTPKNTTNSWICDEDTPSGFGMKCKDLAAWESLKTECINKMGWVSLAEGLKDVVSFGYGNPFSAAAYESGSWRELNTTDGAALHITMYRNRLDTDKPDVTLHLDEISIALDRDANGVSNYDWSRVPPHILKELWGFTGIARPGQGGRPADEKTIADYFRNNWKTVREGWQHDRPEIMQRVAAVLRPFAEAERADIGMRTIKW